MAKRSAPQPPKRSANLSPEQMRAGLRLLDRREQELRAFDVNTIADHGDQNAEALRIKYNTTIAKVFGGDDTKEYEQFRSWALDRGPVYMQMDSAFGGRRGVNLAEVRGDTKKG